MPLHALIVGAGIAGCCAAAALAQRGHRVTLIEREAVWRFQSSGIFIYSNGLNTLRSLGLANAAMAAGFAVTDGRNRYFNHHGEPTVEVFYPPSPDGVLPPILGIKRTQLHQVLLSHLAALAVTPRLNTTLTDLQLSSTGALTTLSDGSRKTFDLVIGADGVRSQLRAWVCGDVTPQYTGFGVWRSVHRRPPALRDKIMSMGLGKRLGIMPISDEHLYLFGTVRQPAGHWQDPQQWPAHMREAFSEFQGPVRPFLDELNEHSEVLYTAVDEVQAPLPWHRGRLVLMGDAAHATTPFMGQGGAMAMDDALTLAQTLPNDPSEDAIASALHRWSQVRAPICQQVQALSRAVGEAGAQEVSDPQHGEQRDADIRAHAQHRVDDFFSWLYAQAAPTQHSVNVQ